MSVCVCVSACMWVCVCVCACLFECMWMCVCVDIHVCHPMKGITGLRTVTLALHSVVVLKKLWTRFRTSVTGMSIIKYLKYYSGELVAWQPLFVSLRRDMVAISGSKDHWQDLKIA